MGSARLYYRAPIFTWHKRRLEEDWWCHRHRQRSLWRLLPPPLQQLAQPLLQPPVLVGIVAFTAAGRRCCCGRLLPRLLVLLALSDAMNE
jgi:hypothetical protein